MDSASSEAGGTQATPNGSEADTEGAGVPVKLAGDALEELLGQMEEYAPTVSIKGPMPCKCMLNCVDL